MLEQGYSVAKAAAAINVGKSTTDKWMRQFHGERSGITPKSKPKMPDRLRIRELERRSKRIELEKEIPKSSLDIGLAEQFKIIAQLKQSYALALLRCCAVALLC